MLSVARQKASRLLIKVAEHIGPPGRRGIWGQIPELEPRDHALLERVRHLTMTGQVAQWEFIRAVRYVEGGAVPGDIVECGVWRGGYLALAGMLRDELGFDREIWGYDTFAGMTEPAAVDRKFHNQMSAAIPHAEMDRGDHNAWCYASLQDVIANFSGVAKGRLRTVKGPVEETLAVASNLPDRIAILRLDTDWYESTKAELEILYPRLSPGGVLIIDDYGEWEGARKAVDEYFAGEPVWLQRVNQTVRMMIKPGSHAARY